MEVVQAFILSMKRESQSRCIYGKSHKEYQKPTSTIKRFTLESNLGYQDRILASNHMLS